MEKLFILFTLCSMILIASPVVHGNGPYGVSDGPKALKHWYRRLPQMKQKVTQLHFYLHDIVGGPNSTNIPIAMANFTAQSPTYFGMIAAMDDLLTAGPSPNSEIVGRAQGLFGSTSLEEIGFHMTFSFVFTSGKYNGSTISLIGRNPFFNEHRELPIVGGSGVFRLARGSALLNTVLYDTALGDAVVEYNVVVLHY
ncbi:hypothetical protein ACJIZ3_015312 [Penstemon smallii]|uniref:Dirigent protein n=1 Tax=Penstemon smallii TaxID=265156 RepID=A0ABD3RM51_9LAMI